MKRSNRLLGAPQACLDEGDSPKNQARPRRVRGRSADSADRWWVFAGSRGEIASVSGAELDVECACASRGAATGRNRIRCMRGYCGIQGPCARSEDGREVPGSITDFVNISHSFCEIFHRPNSAHPSIFALQDGTRGPAPLSTIPYWVVEARELAGTIVHPCLSIHLLMEREMKQRQYITTFSLIVALTGLSPVVVADVAGGKGAAREFSFRPRPTPDNRTHGTPNGRSHRRRGRTSAIGRKVAL